MTKKLLAFALALLLCASLPLSALAAEGDVSSAPAGAESSAPPAEEQGEQLEGAPSSTASAPEDTETTEETSPRTEEETETGDPTGEEPSDSTEDDPTGEEPPEGESEEENPSEEEPGEEEPGEEEPGEEEPGEEESGEEEPGPVYTFITDEHIAYMNGSNDYMNPENNLTRAEAAKIIYTLLENPLAGEEGSSFADVPAGIWYEDYVNSMAAMELIEGYEGNVYKPDSFITRAEFVTILSRVYLPEEGTEDITFSDVPEGYWGYEALKNAVHRGWLEGYPDGSIKPENNITRTEAILVLNRMLDRSPDKNAINNAGKILQYLDVPYGYWAYYDIMEASVPHEHSAAEDGSEVWASFTPKTSERAPGYYLIDGQLYCVKANGYYAKSESIGVLDFNNDGQYTSGSADLDQRLTAIVLAYTDPSASRFTNLRSLYNYVINHTTYRTADWIDEGATGWEEWVALKAFQAGNKGNCYSYAAMFAMLARKLGYQAKGVSGWVTTPYWYWDIDEHGWTQIEENGQTYFCDPELQWNNGWDLFYKKYGSAVTYYIVNGVSLG